MLKRLFFEMFGTDHGEKVQLLFKKKLNIHVHVLILLISDHVIVFMDLVLISHNLNLIGPASILAWAMNC